jgi:hypothetical protein
VFKGNNARLWGRGAACESPPSSRECTCVQMLVAYLQIDLFSPPSSVTVRLPLLSPRVRQRPPPLGLSDLREVDLVGEQADGSVLRQEAMQYGLRGSSCASKWPLRQAQGGATL